MAVCFSFKITGIYDIKTDVIPKTYEEQSVFSSEVSDRAFDGFQFAVRLSGVCGGHSNRNSQQTDVGKRIQVCNRRFISYPHTFLNGIFKAGIVPFAFRTQGIAGFKIFAAAVEGKA